MFTITLRSEPLTSAIAYLLFLTRRGQLYWMNYSQRYQWNNKIRRVQISAWPSGNLGTDIWMYSFSLLSIEIWIFTKNIFLKKYKLDTKSAMNIVYAAFYQSTKNKTRTLLYTFSKWTVFQIFFEEKSQGVFFLYLKTLNGRHFSSKNPPQKVFLVRW